MRAFVYVCACECVPACLYACVAACLYIYVRIPVSQRVLLRIYFRNAT